MQDFDQLYDIKGKNVLVTGGGSGIGEMMTECFAAAGCTVFIASRKTASLLTVADRINQLGAGQVTALTADLSTEAGVQSLAEQLATYTDHLDILCNNSGATWGQSFKDYPREAWDKILNLNVGAIGDVTKTLLPFLEKAASAENPARIINTGSVMGTRYDAQIGGGSGVYSYVASKAAVHHLTKVFANEFAAKHITVNAIAPGPFPSRMMAFATDSEEKRKMMGKTVPLGRVGEPEDIACVLRFLCSKGGGYVSGAIIPLDGGMNAQP